MARSIPIGLHGVSASQRARSTSTSSVVSTPFVYAAIMNANPVMDPRTRRLGVLQVVTSLISATSWVIASAGAPIARATSSNWRASRGTIV